VFESTMLEADDVSQAMDVSGLIGSEQRSESYFIENYTRLFPDRRRMPVGFSVSAFYVNRQLSSFGDAGVSDASELLASMPFATAEQGVSCSGLHSDRFRALYGDTIPLAGRDRFVNDVSGAYFSSTAEYFTVLSEMAGRFRLIYVDEGAVPAEFNSLWSIMPGSGAEQKCAARFMQYMLDENAQHFLHISGQSGSLPINKQTLKTYSEIFADFSDFFVNIDNYLFVPR